MCSPVLCSLKLMRRYSFSQHFMHLHMATAKSYNVPSPVFMVQPGMLNVCVFLLCRQTHSSCTCSSSLTAGA